MDVTRLAGGLGPSGGGVTDDFEKRMSAANAKRQSGAVIIMKSGAKTRAGKPCKSRQYQFVIAGCMEVVALRCRGATRKHCRTTMH